MDAPGWRSELWAETRGRGVSANPTIASAAAAHLAQSLFPSALRRECAAVSPRLLLVGALRGSGLVPTGPSVLPQRPSSGTDASSPTGERTPHARQRGVLAWLPVGAPAAPSPGHRRSAVGRSQRDRAGPPLGGPVDSRRRRQQREGEHRPGVGEQPTNRPVARPRAAAECSSSGRCVPTRSGLASEQPM